MASRTLVCIEIQTPSLVWNRAFISDVLPTKEDLTFYYNRICGIEGTVSFRTESVPETFNETLLYTGTRLPTMFPVHDLETKKDEHDKRAKYNQFLNQLCEMERSRAMLQVFPQIMESKSSEGSSSPAKPASKSRQWVQDLLRSLNTDDLFDDDAIVPATPSAVETAPLGWIMTPVVREVRETRGSRIIIDPALGSHWETLLGTELYPDIVVSRRISTQTWAFQHPTSDALVKATLDWYLAAQDATLSGGMSGWIFNAEREMNALFGTFKRIKVHESLLSKHVPTGGKTSQVLQIITTVEGRCLASALEDATIRPLPTDLFQKYMSYVFMAFQVPSDVYTDMAAYQQSLQRWARGSMGFRAEADPPVESWRDTWNLLMRGTTPTEDRVRTFLKTLDCWNALEAGLLTLQQRKEIADEWVFAFIDNMVVADKGGKIKSVLLHEKVKEWCYKYLPVGLFASNFSPMAIGPLFTRREYNSVKRGDGRYMMGLRFKLPDMEISMDPKEKPTVKVTKAVSITTDANAGTTETQSTVSGIIVSEQDGNRIEHFFSSQTQEIHLGTL
jgi:hypothetical protein